MTTFEHAMCGATLAMALGCQRNQGWGLVAMAGAAAALPDWDGASIVLGGEAYAQVHRVWGHNVLVAGLTGLVAAVLGYLAHLSPRVRGAVLSSALLSRPENGASDAPAPAFSGAALSLWLVVGVLAGLIHLPADVAYSGKPDMLPWPLKLLWPFSNEGWVFPLVPWGSVATTLIFIAEMFALYRWPRRNQVIAVATVGAFALYIGLCWLVREG